MFNYILLDKNQSIWNIYDIYLDDKVLKSLSYPLNYINDIIYYLLLNKISLSNETIINLILILKKIKNTYKSNINQIIMIYFYIILYSNIVYNELLFNITNIIKYDEKYLLNVINLNYYHCCISEKYYINKEMLRDILDNSDNGPIISSCLLFYEKIENEKDIFINYIFNIINKKRNKMMIYYYLIILYKIFETKPNLLNISIKKYRMLLYWLMEGYIN